MLVKPASPRLVDRQDGSSFEQELSNMVPTTAEGIKLIIEDARLAAQGCTGRLGKATHFACTILSWH